MLRPRRLRCAAPHRTAPQRAVFKDASANKGGVTSSSMEVFAALALSDDEYSKQMCVQNDGEPNEFVPDVYRDYVSEVQEIIARNAKLEFEAIWRENERTNRPRSLISDELSNKVRMGAVVAWPRMRTAGRRVVRHSAHTGCTIACAPQIVDLSEELERSSLYDNEALRRTVLQQYCPPSLLRVVTLKQIMDRVPETYLRAIFSAFLASRFVYTHGLDYSVRAVARIARAPAVDARTLTVAARRAA